MTKQEREMFSNKTIKTKTIFQKSRKTISLILSFVFLFSQVGFAQVAVELNFAGQLSQLHKNIFPETFRPIHLRYFSFDNQNNQFKVFLDKGDEQGLSPKGTVPEDKLKTEAQVLLNYFLIGVTLPDEAFWVNLRPDAEDNIIDSQLARTDIGKILLEADLQLKKDTALATSPQTPQGKAYWDKLYQKAAELYGSENITIPTLTRPWIVPNEIILRESKDGSAYIYKATLKVMLEQDHLKGSSVYNFKDDRAKALNEYSSQLIHELIIPKLTKEVNSSKTYAPLRQVYYSLILARWFKTRFNNDQGLSPQGTVPSFVNLINRSNLTGLTSKESWSKTTYFKDYQKSFKDGEYNLKVPVSGLMGQSIRSYFSGGIDLGKASSPVSGFMGNSPEVGVALVKGMQGFSGTRDGALNEITSSSPVGSLIGCNIDLINSDIWALRDILKFYNEHDKNRAEQIIAVIKRVDNKSYQQFLKVRGNDRYDAARLFLERLCEVDLERARNVLSGNDQKLRDRQGFVNESTGKKFLRSNTQPGLKISAIFTGIKEFLGEVDRNKILFYTSAIAASSPINNYIRAVRKLGEIRDNSGLPIDITLLNIRADESSDNILWSDVLRALRFDQLVYRRVEREPIFQSVDVDTDIKVLTVYDVSKKEGEAKDLYSTRTGEQMRKVLMDEHAEVTPEAYFMHRGIWASKKDIQKAFYGENKQRFDITVIPPALWGKEYAKTFGHFHTPVEKPEIYQVVSGEVLWLMQKCDARGNVIDFITVRAKAGDIAIMLPGYGHVSVNISETEPLVMANWLTWKQSSLYRAEGEKVPPYSVSFEDKKGAAYYVIKNSKGQPELVPNPKYEKSIPEPKQMVAKDEVAAFGLTRGEPIYNLVRLPSDEFNRKTKFLYRPAGYNNLLTPEATLDNASLEEKIDVVNLVSSPVESLSNQAAEYIKNLNQISKLLREPGADQQTKLDICQVLSDELQLVTIASINDPAAFTQASTQLDKVIKELKSALDTYNKYKELKKPLKGSDQVLTEHVRILLPTKQQKSEDDNRKILEQYVTEESMSVLKEIRERPGFSSASSPVKSDAPGGIDFRSLPMTIQPMGSFANLKFILPKINNLAGFDVEKELSQIKKMVAVGMIPSSQRIKECVAACYAKGKLKEFSEEMVVCLIDICKLEEQQASETKPELKEVLVILDTV